MELNRIAENIAYKLGDQFNHTLKESIKDTLIVYRAKYVRDDLARNPISYMDFEQEYTIGTTKVNLLDEFKANKFCITSICSNNEELECYTILKGDKKIPKAVRIKLGNKDNYTYIGTVDGMKRFHYTTLDQFKFLNTLSYNKNTIWYTFIGERLYVLNNLNCNDLLDSLEICNILIRGIFVDPRDVWSFCESERFTDDNEFPIAEDMLMSMSNAILRGEYPLLGKDGNEVNIKPDDKK